MKKISISLIVALLIGGMLLNSCSNGATQVSIIETNSTEITQQETLKSSTLDSKLIELYQSTKEKQKENDERNIFGIDEAKFDKDGKLWVKCVEAGDIYREDQIMIENHVFTIYDSIDKHIQYWKEVGIKMNTEQVVSNNCFKDVVGKPEGSTLQEFQTIENEFESMNDCYDELLNVSSSIGIETTVQNIAYDSNGIYDRNNEISILKIIDDNYSFIASFQNGYAFYNTKGENGNKKVGYIDMRGEKAITFNNTYYENKYVADGLYAYKENDKYGFYDVKSGKNVINSKYDDVSIYGFREGLCGVCIDNKWGFIDKNGNTILDFIYESKGDEQSGSLDSRYAVNYSFRDGLAPVKKDGLYGYIDKNGKVVIDFQFQYASSFHDGVASVAKGNKYGFIDKRGNIVIDYIYDGAFAFNHGVGVVKIDNKFCYINKANEIISRMNYDSCTWISNDGLGAVKKDNKWGYMDLNGREVVPCIFDNATSFDNGVAVVKLNDRYLIITCKDSSLLGYDRNSINNTLIEMRSIDTNGLWNKYIERNNHYKNISNWDDDEFKQDLENTVLHKDITPDAWFLTDAGVWYYFEDDRTTTKKGWFVDSRDEQTYYLDPNTGRMAVGWTKIDGEMYYFNESHDNEPNWYEIGEGFYESYGKKVKAYGSMYRDETTPDGKRVDSDGKLIK